MSVTLLDRCCPIEYSPWQKKDLPNDVSPLGKTVKRWEIIDTRDHLHYRGVPPQQISILAFMLFFWTPVYTAAMMIFSVAKTALRIATVVVDFFDNLLKCNLSLDEFPKRGFSLIKHAYEGVRDVVIAPFYGIALCFTAFVGVFIPYEGRMYFARIENHWHSGASYRYDIRRVSSEYNPTSKLISDALTNPNSPYVFYLAYCFQPLERGDYSLV